MRVATRATWTRVSLGRGRRPSTARRWIARCVNESTEAVGVGARVMVEAKRHHADDVLTTSTPPPTTKDGRRGAVVWFRENALRLSDNRAFNAAVERANRRGGKVACVFGWNSRIERRGEASRTWLNAAVASLDADLQTKYGGGGLAFYGEEHDAAALLRAAEAVDAGAVFTTRRYEPEQRASDTHVKEALKERNVELVDMPGALLFETDRIKIDMGKEKYFFGTLMPFVHAADKMGGKPGAPVPAPSRANVASWDGADGLALFPHRLQDLGILPASDKKFDWSKCIRAEWDVSESGALEAWERFKDIKLERYEDCHGDADDATMVVSRLSPYLHFGQISPRLMYHELTQKTLDQVQRKQLSRVFWHRLYRREFAYWQLLHWPNLATQSVRTHYEARDDWLDVENDPEAREVLNRWKHGTTGFPTVDAGMRRLWSTGWMHQSERMIAATFLVDYCRVHWTYGARWFEETLVDADVAINSMMWQNAGKSGLDQWDVFSGSLAPDGTARAHDPKGATIARWIPELAGLPPGHLRHRPWEASAKTLSEANVVLGDSYPHRLFVDVEETRKRMVADVNNARIGEVMKAAHAAKASGGHKPGGLVTNVLVDCRSANDYVIAPPGATKEHAGALLTLSTRKEFKTELKSTAGLQASMQLARTWADSALNVAKTAASKPIRAKSGSRKQKRSENMPLTKKKKKDKRVERKSSSWEKIGSKKVLRGTAAKEAERRVVKAMRRESKNLSSQYGGMSVNDFPGEEEDMVAG
jgi:deoxyribodipyrimidine photo-lyase